MSPPVPSPATSRPLRSQVPARHPPSLQLFDPHHEVEVTLRVLLDDVPHVVGLPSLLRARTHASRPSVPPAQRGADRVGARGLRALKAITHVARQAGLAQSPRGAWACGCPAWLRGAGWPWPAVGLSGPQLPARSPAGPCPLSFPGCQAPLGEVAWPPSASREGPARPLARPPGLRADPPHTRTHRSQGAQVAPTYPSQAVSRAGQG